MIGTAGGRREVLGFLGVLALAVVLLVLTGGSVLWTRPFWMDEIAMFFLTSESSPAEMVRVLARGGDWNPPTLHLLVWTAMRLVGLEAVTPVFLRTFALVSVALALVFVHLTLRRRYAVSPSVAGVLAVAAQGLVVEHAFEGRFYGPWLLFAAAFAWSVGLDAARERSVRRDVAVALTSILLVTIHWYGVFSLGLMCGGVLLVLRDRWRVALRRLAPALAGMVVLLALTPIALSQRASAAPVLWVHPLSLAQVDQMVRHFVPGVLVVIIALAMVMDALRSPPSVAGADATSADNVPPPARDAGVAALLSLAAMPLVLVLLSVALTPSMVFRYAIAAMLAWAPAVAYLAHGFGRPARVALTAGIALMLVFEVREHTGRQRTFADAVGYSQRAFARASEDRIPIVFQRLHVIYPVAATERGPATMARYIDVSDSILDTMYPQPDAEGVRASFRLDRDQARYHAGIYGWPVMAPVESLATTPRFYLLATDATLPPGYSPVSRYGARLFPNHRVRRIDGALALFERDSTRP